MTVSIDHNVVDGAPATRFAADFRRIMQRAPERAADTGPAA
jgi:pyruvate/2-oxoglutarate dehydrogenase complex dihydrolipoamide acyltransferase (E2) component